MPDETEQTLSGYADAVESDDGHPSAPTGELIVATDDDEPIELEAVDWSASFEDSCLWDRGHSDEPWGVAVSNEEFTGTIDTVDRLMVEKLKEIHQGDDEASSEQSSEESEATDYADYSTTIEPITDVSGVDPDTARTLIHAGYERLDDLRRASQRELADVDGIGMALAARIKADVGDLE